MKCKSIITYSIINSNTKNLSTLPDRLIVARNLSNIEGDTQNSRESYILKCSLNNHHQVIASRNNQIIGFCVGISFQTKQLYFGNTSYIGQRDGDTLTVSEICVIESEKNQGIASILLETITKPKTISNLEFTILSSNIPR
jgi:ribosomal protein S18 acetylase RimI-like enzyme